MDGEVGNEVTLGGEKRGGGMEGAMGLMEKHPPKQREPQENKLVCSRISEQKKGGGECYGRRAET